MTRAEALERLADYFEYEGGLSADKDTQEAYKMAIEALKSKPIVHCKNCKYHEDEELGMVWCPYFIGSWVENDFHCAIGEEKEADNE